MAPISRLAATLGLYAARSDQFAGWVIFDDEDWRYLGIIRDRDLYETSYPEAFVHAKLARWSNEMGSLYALADEAQVASRGKRA